MYLSCRRFPFFYHPFLWVLVYFCLPALLVAITGKSINAEEKNEQQWKPMIGNWYDWTDPSGEKWDALDLAVSKEKEKIVFLSRRAPEEETTEHFRAIYFSKRKELLPLLYSVGGKQKIDVYWYETVGEEGQFFRLSDHWGEYLIDLRRGTTGLMLRRRGLTFVGELHSGEDKSGGLSISDYGTRLEVSAYGRPAMIVIGPLATEKGKKIGVIEGR